MSEKLLVLIINDMVIFPNNEVRIEYDNTYDKQLIDLVDRIEDNLMLIINPIEEHSINLTSFPKYGVLGRLKLKMNVPNGKTRIVIEGLDRVEISSYTEENNYFKASYTPVEIIEDENSENYFNMIMKLLENYISKVPYMGNAVMGQINKVDTLSDLCDLIVSYLPLKYQDKKKYITTIISKIDSIISFTSITPESKSDGDNIADINGIYEIILINTAPSNIGLIIAR